MKSYWAFLSYLLHCVAISANAFPLLSDVNVGGQEDLNACCCFVPVDCLPAQLFAWLMRVRWDLALPSEFFRSVIAKVELDHFVVPYLMHD